MNDQQKKMLYGLALVVEGVERLRTVDQRMSVDPLWVPLVTPEIEDALRLLLEYGPRVMARKEAADA